MFIRAIVLIICLNVLPVICSVINKLFSNRLNAGTIPVELSFLRIDTSGGSLSIPSFIFILIGVGILLPSNTL